MSVPAERSVGERMGAKVEDAIRSYGSELISAVSLVVTAVGALPGIFMGPWPWIITGAVLAILAGVLRAKSTEATTTLRNERDAAQQRANSSVKALQDAVTPLAYNLNEYLELFEPHQRLSIYCHFDRKFRLMARVAKNPIYRSSGRGSYSEEQGVIGTVWREGDALERVGRGETWSDWVERFGFSAEEAEGLTMKSNIIAAVRLDHQREPVGIALIESVNSRGITPTQFEKLQGSYITRSLAELLSIAGPHFP